jgi:fimbrial chaperone protein
MVISMYNPTRNKNVAATKPLWKAARCTGYCLATLLLPALAAAAEWEIDPVRVQLSTEQQTAAITVKNASDQPTSLQIEVVAWSQVDGKDVYTASRELLVSPPIVTIPGKGEQVIRAALRRPADATKELSYRINLRELPPPPAAGFNGVQVALRIGLPVFVQSIKGEAAPKMSWAIQRMPDNQFKLGLKNTGNAHVQVTDFALSLPGSKEAIATEATSSYIMAGQTREWLLKSTLSNQIADGRVHLKAFTDAGDVDTDLVLGRP